MRKLLVRIELLWFGKDVDFQTGISARNFTCEMQTARVYFANKVVSSIQTLTKSRWSASAKSVAIVVSIANIHYLSTHNLIFVDKLLLADIIDVESRIPQIIIIYGKIT